MSENRADLEEIRRFFRKKIESDSYNYLVEPSNPVKSESNENATIFRKIILFNDFNKKLVVKQ